MTTQDVKETTRDTIDKPKYKMVVCTSEYPGKSPDGLWRRIRVVDFEHLFTDSPETTHN